MDNTKKQSPATALKPNEMTPKQLIHEMMDEWYRAKEESLKRDIRQAIREEIDVMILDPEVQKLVETKIQSTINRKVSVKVRMAE